MKTFTKNLIFIFFILTIYLEISSQINIGYFLNADSHARQQAYISRALAKPVDTNIVLVNAGKLDRGLLAVLMDILASHNPKVVGINFCFNRNRHTPYDSLLIKSLRKFKNVVFFGHEDGQCEISSEFFYASPSYLQDNYRYVESFKTNNPNLSFEEKTVELFDKNKLDKLKARDKDTELISFGLGIHSKKGSTFTLYDYPAILQGNYAVDFSDKIVLVGYFGNKISPEIEDFEDCYWTPLNKSVNGGTLPDMYSTEIIANIISMIIKESYINEVSAFVNYLIIAFILIVNVSFGYLILKRSKVVYLVYSALILFCESLAVNFLTIFLLTKLSILINPVGWTTCIWVSFITLYFLNTEVKGVVRK